MEAEQRRRKGEEGGEAWERQACELSTWAAEWLRQRKRTCGLASRGPAWEGLFKLSLANAVGCAALAGAAGSAAGGWGARRICTRRRSRDGTAGAA